MILIDRFPRRLAVWQSVMLAGCALLLIAGRASATDYSWNAPVSSAFSFAGNWNPVGVPGSSDAAIFDLGSAGYDVSLTSNTVNSLQIGNDTLSLQGNLTATRGLLPSIALGINAGDVANLTLPDSNIIGVNDAIGYAAQSQGTATLTSSSWTSTRQYVGYAGIGALALSDSSTATVKASEIIGAQTGSQGTVTLDSQSTLSIMPPQNSSLSLVVGASGTGTLTVRSGLVTLSDKMVVAQNALSQGTVTLDGANSHLTTPEAGTLNMSGLTVGMGGAGSMSITNGASATIAGPLVMGQNIGSQGSLSVTGAKSILAPPGFGSADMTSATVGASGDGSLSVSAGASAILSGQVEIGQNAGSHGTVTVDGQKSVIGSLNAGQSAITGVTVGDSGQGSLSATGGGVAKLSGPLVLGNATGGNGSIEVDGTGSKLISDHFPISSVVVGNSGVGNFSIASGGSATFGNPFTVASGAGAQGTVTVDGVNSVLSLNGATIGGAGAGTLSITNSGQVATSNGFIIGRDVAGSGGLTIDGANSKLVDPDQSGGGAFTIGKDGHGQISVTNGGAITASNGSLLIGADAGSVGVVSVDGVGSSVSLQGEVPSGIATIQIGQNGAGSLSVTGGATVASGPINVGPALVGSAGQGSLSLDGAGSKLSISGPSANSTQVNGSVSITGGAVWSTGDVDVGPVSDHTATIVVDGANSKWTSSSFIGLASDGASSLTISNGGAVSASILTSQAGTTINIQGGTLTVPTLNINGTLIDNGTITGGITMTSGVVSGDGKITGRLQMNGGTVSPGNSPGTLTVGGLTMSNANFKFEINSATGTAGGPIGWDLLNVLISTSLSSVPGNITLDLVSLTAANVAGNVSDFDPTQSYHWTFLTTGLSAPLFNPASIAIDTSGFSNPTHGQFSVSEVGKSLVLNYSPVPEPGTLALAILGLGGLALAGWRGRAKA